MGFIRSLAAAAAVVASVSAECTPLGEAASAAGLTSLVETVTAVAELEGAAPLLAAVTATEKVDEPVTLFAPTNEAFEAIVDAVQGLSAEQVLAVLFNHVVAGELPAAAVVEAVSAAAPEPVEVPSLLGALLEVSGEGEDLFVSPVDTDIMAKVVVTDVETCAGVVHVVDAVLVPNFEAVPAPEFVSSAYGDVESVGAY